MDDKILKKIWLLSIVIILIAFSIYLINKEDIRINTNSLKGESVQIVKNYNDFYTVNSCIYRYLTYLQNNDTNSLLKVLNEDFIRTNGINSTNIYNYLISYDGNVNFNSKKMYYEEMSSNVIKYYVYGYVEKDIMDSFPEQIDAYYIVILDKENKVFSIQPYNGEIFK